MNLRRTHTLTPTLSIIKGMIALLVMVGLLVSQAPVSADSPQELIDMRTRTSKTYQVDENSYILEASIGSIHYKDDPDDPNEQWKDIEPDIVSSPKANWNWEVVKGNWHLLIRDDTTVALGKDGHWIGFRYEGIAYLDWESKEYHILQTRQDVTPVITGNRIIWQDIFYGTDLEYIYTPDGFKENLIISQETRDWLATNPPSSFGLNNQTTYIGGYIECDWQNAYPAEDYFGTPIDWDNPKEFANFGVFWRHPIKDKIITALPLGYALHDDVAPEDLVKLRHRFYKADGKNWLLFGAKVTDLNQYPAGEIIIDPTVDEQVGASSDDCYRRLGGSDWDTTETEMKCGDYNPGWWDYRGGMRFQTVNIDRGVTIDATSYITLKASDAYGSIPDTIIEGEDVDDAATFSTSGDYDGRDRTSASTSWTPVAWVTDTEYNSDSIASIIQEIIDRGGWSANNDMVLFWRDANGYGGSNKRVYAYSWDYDDNSHGPKLHIEYSADGVSTPTVVTNPATSVEETTATLSGNITATGGENCTDRGFQWDIDTGVPYSSNWTEAGDFGISNFTHGLTSLTEGELYYYRAGANNTAGWGWGSEVTFLTKPDEPINLTDTARTAAQITLTWTLGSGSDNTTIRYRTDQYPTDYNDGTLGYGGTASTCNVTGLSAGQIYYFRAWSWCSEGALEQWSDTYSQDTGYTLPGDPANLATSNPQKTSLDLDWTKGTGDNLTMVRGQTGSYPTGVGDGDQIYYDSGNSTTDSGLQANTTYYYRAWAYDSESGYYSSGYSQDTGTTAMPDAPTVTTGNATDVTDTTATLNGNITDTGDQNADTRGFEWGLSTGNYSDNWTEVGSYGTGVFSHGLTLLSANTTYYSRAMAHNDGGWGYGGEIDFTTSSTPAEPPGTPTGLTLIDLGAVTINASWGAGTGNTTSYLLLVDRDGYPDSANASLYELAYSGNLSSANLTGFDMDDNAYYFSLWGYNDNGYSENYTTASIGTGINWLAFITEADMETLADTLGDFLLIAVVAGISILAYWHRDRLLYVLAGLALMSYAALQWGENIYIGLILIVLGLYTFAKAAWGARRA